MGEQQPEREGERERRPRRRTGDPIVDRIEDMPLDQRVHELGELIDAMEQWR